MASLELGAEDRTTSAYNLGKSGLVSKVLRIMDLVRAAAVARSSLGRVLLGGLLGMSQFGLWRFLSQGWMNMGGVWKAVENPGLGRAPSPQMLALGEFHCEFSHSSVCLVRHAHEPSIAI